MKRYKSIFKEADLKDFSSGFNKSKKSIELVKKFLNGVETVDLIDYKGKKRTFKVKRKLKGTDLKKDMIISASYNDVNQGFDIYEFIGVTDDSSAYGKKPKKIFTSVDKCLKYYNVKSLKELEELQNENEYGYFSYLIVKDLKEGTVGPWFYLYEGQWCRGGGAEPLTFAEVQEVK